VSRRPGPDNRHADVAARGRFLRWSEGRHWQIDGKRLSAWVGIAGDRWMVGVIFNYASGTLGFGLGPIYAGVGV
jgi:hypothetical protein